MGVTHATLFCLIALCISYIEATNKVAEQRPDDESTTAANPGQPMLAAYDPFNGVYEPVEYEQLEKRSTAELVDAEGDGQRNIRSPLGTMRFGKRGGPLQTMRFGKRAAAIGPMRFGKRSPLGTMRFGKRNYATEFDFMKRNPLGTMRFGKRSALEPY